MNFVKKVTILLLLKMFLFSVKQSYKLQQNLIYINLTAINILTYDLGWLLIYNQKHEKKNLYYHTHIPTLTHTRTHQMKEKENA